MSFSSSPASSGDEGSDTMGRHHYYHGRGQPRRPDLDMSAALNLEQKNQLQVLVNTILEGMQKQIREVFDTIGNGQDDSELGIITPKPTCNLIPNPRSVKHAHRYGREPLPPATATNGTGNATETPTNGTNTETNKENVRPRAGTPLPMGTVFSAPLSAAPELVIPKSPEEATALSKKTENEILTDTMIEMKRDALTQFGKWRHFLLKRIGDIVIRNGGTSGIVASQGQQQGNSRRPGSAGRGRPAKPSVTPTFGTTEFPCDNSDATLASHHPASPTPLSNLSKEKRALIMHLMTLLLLGLESYTTYSRILLMEICSSLGIPMHVLSNDEHRIALALSQVIKGIPPDEIAQRRAEEARSTRRWKVGLASAVGGSSGITPTGSMASPLVAAGLGTVFGGLGMNPTAAAGLLGTTAESTVVIGTLFGLYGARATGKMMDSYAKDIPDFAFMPLRGSLNRAFIDPKDLPTEDRRMRVTLCIGGWLTDVNGINEPFKSLGDGTEVYALRWELETLTKMGQALDTVTKSAAWTLAKKEIVGRDVFTSLTNSAWPTGLLKISKVIDNPWSVGMVRAEKNGLTLADAIMNKLQGERGISLIGYSLGARSIYACLMQLAEKRAFGVIENVILMGAPCPTETRTWAAMRSVVAGRLINVYSKNDYILGFLYRGSTWHYGVAGLQKIQGVQGVESFDFSDIVSGHQRYQYMVGPILQKVSWEDINKEQVSIEEKTLNEKVAEENQRDKARVAMLGLDNAIEAKKVKDQVQKKDGGMAKSGNKKKSGRGGKQGG